MNTTQILEKTESKETTEKKKPLITEGSYSDDIASIKDTNKTDNFLDHYTPPKKDKKYAINIGLYMYATTDKKVKKLARKLAKKLDLKYDSWAHVESIHNVPFGTIGQAREVKL